MSGRVEPSSRTKIILKSSDSETFEIDKVMAMESQTIKNLIEDLVDEIGITIPNVTSNILAKVIEYCKKQVYAASSDEKPFVDELKKWDAEFIMVGQRMLYDLISVANYLNIQSLLDLTCKTVADMIKGKTPEEIRETFNIVNNYSVVEEEEFRQEYQWDFE